MYTLSKNACSIAAITLAFNAGSAQVALVNFTLTGDVVYVDSGDLFGLNGGETVSVVGMFDDVVLTGRSGTISFASIPGNSFTVTAGSYTFTH